MNPDTDQLQVLLVEDSRWMVESITQAIERLEFPASMRIVSTEDEAVRHTMEDKPHLMILDLRLRQGNGFGVLRRLQKLPYKPRIIVLTNYALPRYREMSHLMGADYFVDKAMLAETLPAILQSIAYERAGFRK